MRPHDSNYDEFDDFDDFGYPEVRAIRHMVNERQRDELGPRGRRRSRLSEKDRWQDEEWSSYDDYDDNDYGDYNADEFDTYAGLIIDQH